MEQVKLVLDLKYQYEHARQERLLLNEQIAQDKLPRSFDALQGPPPHSFRTLVDTQLEQQLRDRQQAILQRHRKEMITLYLATVEANLETFDVLFKDAIKKMQIGRAHV